MSEANEITAEAVARIAIDSEALVLARLLQFVELSDTTHPHLDTQTLETVMSMQSTRLERTRAGLLGKK